MSERTKIVIDYVFYYADQRATSPTAFAGEGMTYDKEAGDVLERSTDGTLTLRYADGREVEVPPVWLWKESRERKVVVQEP